MNAPLLRIQRDGHAWTATGVTSCLLGHRLPRGDGSWDGVFAEWQWNGTELEVRNDRYGIQPLYYTTEADGLAVSGSPLPLIATGTPSELDDGALSVFLRRGYFLGEDTPFRAIRALPPNALLRWRDGTLSIVGGLTLLPPTALDRATAIDAFIDTFHQAVRRRAAYEPDTVVALSGGEDSRHILLELCGRGHPPRACVTYGSWWGEQRDDLRIARRVAASVNVPHVALTAHGPLLAAERRKNVMLGFSSYRHPQGLILGDYLRAHRVGAVFDGLGGDILARNDGLNPVNLALMESRQFERRARLLLSMGDGFMRLLTPEAQRRFGIEPAVARMSAELARHAEAPNPVGSFVFWNFVRREVALGIQLLAPAVRAVLTPYLDHDVYDLLAALPARMLMDHRFHRDAILRAHPRQAQIPFAANAWSWTHSLHVRRYVLALVHDLVRAPARMLALTPTVTELLYAVALGRTTPSLRLGATDLSALARIAHLVQLERFIDSRSARSGAVDSV